MSPIATLQTRVEQLQHCFSTLSGLTSARPDDWRRRHVGIRREANAVLSAIASALAECPEADAEMKPLFVRLRHGVTLHQAEWPVVDIDLDDPVYRSSVRDLTLQLDALVAASRSLGRRAA